MAHDPARITYEAFATINRMLPSDSASGSRQATLG